MKTLTRLTIHRYNFKIDSYVQVFFSFKHAIELQYVPYKIKYDTDFMKIDRSSVTFHLD